MTRQSSGDISREDGKVCLRFRMANRKSEAALSASYSVIASGSRAIPLHPVTSQCALRARYQEHLRMTWPVL